MYGEPTGKRELGEVRGGRGRIGLYNQLIIHQARAVVLLKWAKNGKLLQL